MAKLAGNGDDANMSPPERIAIELSREEAIVLYELLRRYHDAGSPELTTDRAEWRALVLFCGALERNGAAEIPDYANTLAQAKRELGSYDNIPF